MRMLARRSTAMRISLTLVLALVLPSRRLAVHAATPLPPEFQLTLVAEQSHITLKPGLSNVPVWTYNGTVPGPEIRVQQGTHLSITLVNHLPEATTLHWHGLIAPNQNDGVPGLTQDAILPGHSFTYSFMANDPGTYWYHAHQQSADQVDKGLYGALIVLPAHDHLHAALDQTLILDEWPLPSNNSAQGMNGMSGRSTMPGVSSSRGTSVEMQSYLADPGMAHYRTFTINGHAYPATTAITAAPGSLIHVRLINAGYLTHFIHLHGTPYTLVATDGSPVNQPSRTTDLLPIAPGQRMAIEFPMPDGAWSLHDHSGLPGAEDMRVLVGQHTQRSAADTQADQTIPPLLDIAHYGSPTSAPFSIHSRFDRVFRLVLNQEQGQMPGMAGMPAMDAYTINNARYPHTQPLMVQVGQRVEIVFVNKSTAAHPMHIHGHRFQVLELNDVLVSGSPLYQDTVMVLPGKTTIVGFTADNPGLWMLHCHELHHAAAGMATLLDYQGYPHRYRMSDSTAE